MFHSTSKFEPFLSTHILVFFNKSIKMLHLLFRLAIFTCLVMNPCTVQSRPISSPTMDPEYSAPLPPADFGQPGTCEGCVRGGTCEGCAERMDCLTYDGRY